MRRLRPADDVAPGLGAALGRGALLFARLPPPVAGTGMTRRRALVLGDWLDLDASAFNGFDPARNTI